MATVWKEAEALADWPPAVMPARQHTEALGLYVHIPFCQRKCIYCDFNTYAGLQHLIPAAVEALCTEIALWGARTQGMPVDTIFLGGGTPTILAPSQIRQLLDTLRTSFVLAEDCEITSEANPGTADQARFEALAQNGVNRISIGAQSFHKAELDLLGRWHTTDAIGQAVESARQAGLDNINLDLIHGLPHQSLSAWDGSLEAVLNLAPAHVSLYQLTVEDGTPLARMVQTGQVAVPDEDQGAAQYQRAQARLARAGYVQYEIANWVRGEPAQPWARRVCRHNLKYWRNQSYLGFGPGAHSHWRAVPALGLGHGRRWWNLDSVPRYNRCMRDGHTPILDCETIDASLAMAETMMLGLRLVQEGVAFTRFRREHGADLDTIYAHILPDLAARGLVQVLPDRVRLSSQGIMFHNYVSRQFLPAGNA